ncbi:MAG: HK97 gp10 family phage protein [Enterococcus sp.]
MSNDFKFTSYKDKVMGQMDAAAERGMTKVLEIIKSAAKAGAAVSSGQLRSHIDYQLKKIGAQIVGVVGSPDQYAIYVEFGTGEFAENGNGRKGGWVYQAPSGEWFFTLGQEAQPFMRPAFRQNKNVTKEILSKELGATFKGK